MSADEIGVSHLLLDGRRRKSGPTITRSAPRFLRRMKFFVFYYLNEAFRCDKVVFWKPGRFCDIKNFGLIRREAVKCCAVRLMPKMRCRFGIVAEFV